MKTVGNGRKNVLTIPAPVFFCRERKREREGRTGKRNRYYGISGTEYFERERLDYDREAVTQNGNINICNHLKQWARCNNSNHTQTSGQVHNVLERCYIVEPWKIQNWWLKPKLSNYCISISPCLIQWIPPGVGWACGAGEREVLSAASISELNMRFRCTKYGNTAGNFPARIREPWIRSGKFLNWFRSRSCLKYGVGFPFPVFPAKTVCDRLMRYTVSVGTEISHPIFIHSNDC